MNNKSTVFNISFVIDKRIFTSMVLHVSTLMPACQLSPIIVSSWLKHILGTNRHGKYIWSVILHQHMIQLWNRWCWCFGCSQQKLLFVGTTLLEDWNNRKTDSRYTQNLNCLCWYRHIQSFLFTWKPREMGVTKKRVGFLHRSTVWQGAIFKK